MSAVASHDTRAAFDNFRARVPEGQSGEWKVERFSVTEHGSALNSMRRRGYVSPGEYTRLLFGRWDTVMSDTRDEYWSQAEFISRASGRVLINGLGLGCVLNAVVCKLEVEHVDVVEASGDVIALVWPTFAGNPKLALHHADAFKQAKAWPAGTRWNTVWHDIWTSICTGDLTEHAALLRSYARRCEWQGAWKHEELSSLKRQGR